jgi:hypothetical protein
MMVFSSRVFQFIPYSLHGFLLLCSNSRVPAILITGCGGPNHHFNYFTMSIKPILIFAGYPDVTTRAVLFKISDAFPVSESESNRCLIHLIILQFGSYWILWDCVIRTHTEFPSCDVTGNREWKYTTINKLFQLF